jgi:hypothetical protein
LEPIDVTLFVIDIDVKPVQSRKQESASDVTIIPTDALTSNEPSGTVYELFVKISS